MESDRGMRMRGAAIALLVALLWSTASASVGNIAIYWGQNGPNGEEASLKETCASGNFEIVLVSYLLINGEGETPKLNVANHPIAALNADIKSCQSSGIKVFLSLDGAVASAEHAQELASYLWDNFLGGESESSPVGDAVLDGIDFGYYEASTKHWDDLARAISKLSTSSKKVYLSAAPQCPYPDAWLGTALETGLFDYVWIQFFNNPSCEYVTDATALMSSWNEWTNSVHTIQARGFYLGLPAAPGFNGTSGGYIESDKLISEVLPQIKASSKYGGVTLWTKYWDEKTNYSSSIKPYVNISEASAGEVGIYWGQNGPNGEEASLKETCASSNFEIVLVSYLLINGEGETPKLNVANHPIAALNADIKSCQSSGIKVFLSLDGAVASAEHAQELASYLWDNFLGGESESSPVGDAVLDGIDFGYYEASTEHWDDLARAISKHSTSSKKVYLSAAPQCPYPDAWLGTALETGLFDYVWIQFFNNPSCEYVTDATALVSSWNEWTNSVHTIQARGFYLGLPAAPGFNGTSGGYIESDKLISEVLPQIKASSKYGGVTLWTKYWDEKTNYSSSIKPYVNISGASLVEVLTLASM